MSKTTQHILKRARRLADNWSRLESTACGHEEDVLLADQARERLFDYLKTELERLSSKAGEL